MTEDAIPDEVRSLIDAHIDSVMVMEMLLLLYHQPQREWSPAEVASELRIEEAWTQAKLKALARAGLACEAGSPLHSYRYYPSSMDVNAAVAALARTYGQRPQAVIALIHSKPSTMMRWFADPFRVRA